MLIERILPYTIAGKGRSRNIDLFSNCVEHCSGNLFHFHEGATRKLQQGELDCEPQAIRRSSSTIDEFPFLLSKRVVTCNVSIRKVRGNLCQRVTLLRVEV